MNSSGNVGIGISSDPTWKLSVDGITRLNNVDTRLYVASDYISFDHQDGEDPILFSEYDDEVSFYPEGHITGYIGYSSRYFYKIYGRYVYANGVSLTSDLRMKENIRSLVSPLEKIMTTRGVKYDFISQIDPNWKESKRNYIDKRDKNRIGFIAQELKEVYPELVIHDKENDEYSIDYFGMIPVLVEAIKEQQTVISDLSDQIATLQNLKKSSSIASSIDPSGETTNAELYQNIPNPFNENTVIKYSISEIDSYAMINVYDLQGSQVKSFRISQTGEGEIQIPGSDLNPGLYIYNLLVDGFEVSSMRMVLTE